MENWSGDRVSVGFAGSAADSLPLRRAVLVGTGWCRLLNGPLSGIGSVVGGGLHCLLRNQHRLGPYLR